MHCEDCILELLVLADRSLMLSEIINILNPRFSDQDIRTAYWALSNKGLIKDEVIGTTITKVKLIK